MSKRKTTVIPPSPVTSPRNRGNGVPLRRTAPGSAGPSPAKRPGGGRRAGWVGLGALLILLASAAGLWFRHETARPSAARVPAATPAVSVASTEQAFRDTVARLPQDPDARRGLARYLLDQRRPFEALWHFRIAQELNPADPDTPIGAASALAQAGLPERAISLLQSCLAQTPSRLEARRALAEVALSTARPEQALSALAGAGPALAASAPAQLLLGDARLAAGDPAGARKAYQRAVALESEGAAAHDRLGRLALARHEWAQAKQEFAAARERDPGDSGSAYRLGLAYQGAGQQDEAEHVWQELAASAPRYAPAQIALGRLAQGRKQWDTAAAHLVAAVNADPVSKEAEFSLAEVMTAQGERASAAYQRGIYYLETDRPHLALAEFRRIETLAPGRVDGPRMTALALIRMKKLDLAAVVAERGLAKHPGNPVLLGQLGLQHILGRNRPRATQLCEQWRKEQPNAAEPYRLLARIAREESRPADALRLSELALARDPQDAMVCAELAKNLAAVGGPENNRRAVEMAQRATALSPREADYWLELGTALRAVGREPEAADAFLRALDLDASSLPACNALVSIAARQRHAETSRVYASLVADLQSRRRTGDLLWRAVYQQPQDAAAHERLARFLLQIADLRRASYQLEELASLRPDDAAVRRDLARVKQLLDLQQATGGTAVQ